MKKQTQQKPASADLRAEAIRAALAAIAEANHGYLNPAHVVDAARDPSSPLHDEFEWSDESAADAYRLAQAGALIRRVKFTVVRTVAETRQVAISTARAYQSRQSARRDESGGYESVADIMQDSNKREELLQQVLRELQAYRKRYAEIAALADVWHAIDDAIDILTAPPRQAEAGQAGLGPTP